MWTFTQIRTGKTRFQASGRLANLRQHYRKRKPLRINHLGRMLSAKKLAKLSSIVCNFSVFQVKWVLSHETNQTDFSTFWPMRFPAETRAFPLPESPYWMDVMSVWMATNRTRSILNFPCSGQDSA